MVILTIFYPRHFPKTQNPAKTIFNKIDRTKELDLYSNCLKKAVIGKYKSGAEMKHDLLHVMERKHHRYTQQQRVHSRSRLPSIIETMGILLLAIAFFISSIFLL